MRLRPTRIYNLLMAALAAVLVLLMLSSFAMAQTVLVCWPREMVVSRFADRDGKALQSRGISENGELIEIFASPDTGTWTIAVTFPDGQTCPILSGQSFETIEGSLTPEGAPL